MKRTIPACGAALILLAAPARSQDNGARGLAAGFPGDAGIEKHPAVLFASGFERGFAGWTEHDPGVSVIVHNPASAQSGRAFLQTTATRGRDTGGDVVWKIPGGVDLLYVRFYCRFDRNTVMPHHFVKIRAVHDYPLGSAGRRPLGDRAFWTGIEPTRERTWHFYTYWHRMRSWQNPDGSPRVPGGDGRSYYGNTFHPDDQTPFDRERWICVEAMLKANTPGRSDGEMAFWIDGVKRGHWKPGAPTGTWIRDRFVTSGTFNKNPAPFEGFDFRTDARVKINAVALQWYVSEETAKTGDADRNIVYFDDVVIATERIGPQTPGASHKRLGCA